MSVSSPTTSGEQILHAALELSKNSWLLAIQLPDRDNPSLHPITGGHRRSKVRYRRKSRRTGNMRARALTGLHPS